MWRAGCISQDTYLLYRYLCRYNVNGFVEELPQMPEPRSYHACAALPSTKVRLAQPRHAFMFRHSSLLGAMHLDLAICLL